MCISAMIKKLTMSSLLPNDSQVATNWANLFFAQQTLLMMLLAMNPFSHLQPLEKRGGASGFMSVPKTADPVSFGAAEAADGGTASPLSLAWIRRPQACSGAGCGSSGQDEDFEPHPFRSQSPGPRDEPAYRRSKLDGSFLGIHGGVCPGINQRLNGKVCEHSVCNFN